MEKRFDVVGLGYTAIDYVGIVPHFPLENLKMEMKEFLVQGGGPAATAIVTARRLGLSAAFVGKVGDDDFGERMLDELEVEGVDVSNVIIETGARSQFAFIMVDESSAARTILWTRGSVSEMKPSELDSGLVTSARALLVDSMEPGAALEAARAAHGCGIPVVIDAGTLRGGVEDILPFCDFIVASEVFAGQISNGGSIEDALRVIFSLGPEAAVVTLGEKGCAALSGDGMIEVEGFDIEAVDTTGAGDVFHGAFLFAVLQGWDLHRMCVFANAVAALKCRRLGGRAGIPDLQETTAFLRRSKPALEFRVG